MTHWRFAFATDIHVGSPRSFRFSPAWNENWRTAVNQISGCRPSFLLLGGDITRDGSLHRYELEAVKEMLEKMPFPYHVVAGNMDTGNKHTTRDGPLEDRDDVSLNVTSEQLQQFSEVFGPLWWSFDHRGVRFSGFCDMILGSGLPEEGQLWQWLEEQAERSLPESHVWITHSPLFVERHDEGTFDITTRGEYLDWYFNVDKPSRTRVLDILRSTRTKLVLSGHVHCRKHHRAFGIDFWIGPSTAFPQWQNRWSDGDPSLGFLCCEVEDDDIRVVFVPLERESTAVGYGPGGHPLPKDRDYSVAWQPEGEPR